ncbi:MAG: transposase [Eubacterium sp.]|nr:transposase [Eubacterium sp.]
MQTTVTSKWYKKGSKPKVKSFPSKSKISYSGFVIPQTGVLFTDSPQKFNYLTSIESVRAFLKASPAPQGKKFAIVMDNAPWHKKMYRLVVTEKIDEYADIRDSVDFIMLPPYSPDLNPIEQVWRITRRENTNNTFFDSVSSLKSTVDNAFSQWKTPNNQLHSLCSRM